MILDSHQPLKWENMNIYLGIKIYFSEISTFLCVVVEIFCDIRLSSYLNTLRKKENIFSPCKRYFRINSMLNLLLNHQTFNV